MTLHKPTLCLLTLKFIQFSWKLGLIELFLRIGHRSSKLFFFIFCLHSLITTIIQALGSFPQPSIHIHIFIQYNRTFLCTITLTFFLLTEQLCWNTRQIRIGIFMILCIELLQRFYSRLLCCLILVKHFGG